MQLRTAGKFPDFVKTEQPVVKQNSKKTAKNTGNFRKVFQFWNTLEQPVSRTALLNTLSRFAGLRSSRSLEGFDAQELLHRNPSPRFFISNS